MQQGKRSTKHTLGQLILTARKAKRMTYRAVAEASATSHGFIADLEAGRRNATDDVLTRIAKAIGIEARVLLRASAVERIARLTERADRLRKAMP